MAEWDRVGALRRDFADMVEGLSPEQLEQQSLCDAWTARGVLCHVTSFVATSLPRFMFTVARSRGDFGRASQTMARTQLDRPVADVIAELRAKATKSAPLPMFPEEMTLTDMAIHTQDVRRPLGLEGSLSPDTLRDALDFLTTHKHATTLVDRKPLDGVKLAPSDIDWAFGDGAEITGPAEAIMMALADRPVALDEISGEGAARWR
ncbi:MAG: maleylpyruvate isomerase family mycothiol-dependent enzyme [Ilumatobacter sp.]|uniref:maleylpyruvate isomerase family mycothiol-dependent enzyme n=1 Tax=Ilumatobacter sp. TaxID=1967498 RepID=UPI0026177D03|nr:maleylpyruvate isomerase family mycothiol-dependent enzyme [Ilumatobacter sp.]MDJ0768995.1 maleylpyruvate isomerase family mycothiol-dependent enzyme [Ilumatobacter sp.]